MTGNIKSLLKRLIWIIGDATWLVHSKKIKRNARVSPSEITIGITTYMDRFETCLKPLLRRITMLFPSARIIVTGNGHYREAEQKNYLVELENYCRRFPNVELKGYLKPQGLSSLWNFVMNQAKHPGVLMLNDDLVVRHDFSLFMMNSGILDCGIATINNSWSHFYIKDSLYRKVGMFDENMTEIGGEDDDYLARLSIMNIEPDNFMTSSVGRKSSSGGGREGRNSYGRIMSEELGGYSTANTLYLWSKWETSDSWFEGAVEVKGRKTKYWKLRKGVNAPEGAITHGENGEPQE